MAPASLCQRPPYDQNHATKASIADRSSAMFVKRSIGQRTVAEHSAKIADKLRGRGLNVLVVGNRKSHAFRAAVATVDGGHKEVVDAAAASSLPTKISLSGW